MRELDLSLRSLRVAVREYRARLRGEVDDRPMATNRRPGGAGREARGTLAARTRAKLKTWLSALRSIAGKVVGRRRG